MALLWGLFAVCLVIISSLTPSASAATSTYLNFQARLLNSSGGVVSDGNYHVEFKLYDAASSSGSSQGSCAGDSNCKWTETRSTGNLVRVVNGYLTVNLGSVTAFPGTINWDQQLWLTMNIGGTGSVSWDGEMNPRILLTALPYAFKSAEAAILKKGSGANTGTLSFNTVANNPNIVLPDASGTVCLQSSASCGFVTGSDADYIQNGTVLQTANFNIQSGASGSIAAVISGAAGQSADILQVRADSVTDPLFKIGPTGEAIFRNSGDSATAFQVQDELGAAVLSVNTSSAGISVTGSASASTSVITPLLTTASGALTLDTGSAAAINIGAASSPVATAINLNVNTTIASTKTLTVAGGQTTLVANGAADGIGLSVSNSSGNGAIAVFRDNANSVVTIANEGATSITPTSSLTGSALSVTQSGNPTSGNAVIKANNTNASPSGNLLDLQNNSVSQFSVDASGNVTTNGQLSFAATGNSAGTIRKSMIVSTAIDQYDIVIINTSVAGRVTSTATANSVQVFGIATADNASTNGTQDIVTGGVYKVNVVPADANVGDDVAIGDFITTSSTAGKGQVNNAAPAGTVIGRALSTDDANSEVWIYVTPGAGGSPTSLQQAYNLSTSPEIVVNSTNGAVTVRDNSTPLVGNANLFEVQNNAGSTTYLGVNDLGISVTGTATVSTSLQTPLITTGSGNLALQPATGVVALNKTSATNELRIYENHASPSVYLSVRSGNISTSSGALAIDTGSAAAISIGTTNANAITLGANTTVSSGKTLTVAGGLTSLTADGGSNGDGLSVSNSTGNGNIAVFKDNASSVFTLANSGYAVFTNSTNSLGAFQIQNAAGSNAFTIDTNSLNSLIINGNFENATVSAWTAKGTASAPTRDSSTLPYIGGASLQSVAGVDAGSGVKYDVSLSNSTTYALSFSLRSIAGTSLSASNFEAGWNNGSTDTACTLSPSMSDLAPTTSSWVRYTCTFTGSTSGHIYWKLSSAVGTAVTFNIDAVQLEQANAPTGYRETALALNGLINSPLSVQNRVNSNTAFQIQNANGASIFRVDTIQSKVSVSGELLTTSLTASGNVTGEDFYYEDGYTAQKRYNLGRTLPDTLNNFVEIGSFNTDNGTHSINMSVKSIEPVSVSKQYLLAIKTNHTNNTWKDVTPIIDSGPDGSDNFVLEVNSNGDIATFRVRRSAGSTADVLLNINIIVSNPTDAFTTLSGTGSSGAGNGGFIGSPLVQDSANGRVGIQNAAPAYTLDVTGTINATTAIQAPLIATLSGDLSIQAASGIVSLNEAVGGGNELRVYDATPTHYTAIKHGSILTSNGALAIDTGSSAAINIGTTNASAVNLGANTTVASGETFTVTSGQTTLNASGTSDALRVVNTGTGNIATFFDSGTAVLNIQDGGIATFKNTTDSATAFQVQDASGYNTLVVDNVTGHLKIYENIASPIRYVDIYYDNATSTATFTASSGTVAVGPGAGAITLSAGSGAAINMTANATSLWRTTAGTLTLQSGTSSDLIFDSGSSIISVSGSSVIKLGASAGDPGTCTAGAIVYNTTTNKLRGCEGSTLAWADIVNGSGSSTLQSGYSASTGGSTPEVKVDSTRGALDIQDANSSIAGDLLAVRASNAGGLGTVLLGVDSSGNTQLQSSGGIALFRANASSTRVEIGSPTPHASNAVVLILDNYNNASDPSGTNGAVYYNASVNKFRCYENSVWKDCISGFNTVTKTANQAATQSSTTFQNDNTLAFSVATNSSYIFEAWIPVDSSDTTADLKYTFTVPTGATMQVLSTRPAAAANSTSNTICNITTSGNTCADTTVNTTAHFIKVEGYVVTGGTAGTVNFQFAQNTSTAASFPVIKAGASLSWKTTN